MRITNSMMVSQYTRNLSSTLGNLNTASQQVSTGRKFETASGDPASAVKAYQLRREYTNNEIYIKNAQNLDGMLAAQEAGIMELHSIAETISSDLLQGLNGTNAESREIIATKLDELQNTMLASLNSKFADTNAFGGSQVKEPPFSLEGGELHFRGINVNTKDPDELAQLEKYSNEEILVDVGFGLTSNADGIASQSGVNSALPGINIVGFGHTTVDGKDIPNNIFSLISDISTELRSDDFDIVHISGELEQFEKAKSQLLISVTEIGSKTSFLENTVNRLENTKLNLNEKMVFVEKVDPETAIMNMKMYEYSYTAALSMGSKILQPSFIDFMR